MRPALHSLWRAGAGLATLGAVLAAALLLPMPALPDGRRGVVEEVVRERLPGWRIERVDPSWEGAYTVVTSCAGQEIGFQFVPGHGLPAEDAWLRPGDAYSRERLDEVSDHWRYLIWRADPERPAELSCRDEIARLGEPLATPRIFE